MSLILKPLAVTGCVFFMVGSCFAAGEVVDVSGRVTDEAGKPLPGVAWWISGTEAWRDGKWELWGISTGRSRKYATDEDGRFQVPFNGKQRYDLQFQKGGYAPSFLFQLAPDSPEPHVMMKKGVMVTGEVEVSGKNGHAFGGQILVSLRLPNPRGNWFKTTKLVDHTGRFRFHASAPPRVPGMQESPQWQVGCCGEVVSIDVQDNTRVDEVLFQIDVTSRRRSANSKVVPVEKIPPIVGRWNSMKETTTPWGDGRLRLEFSRDGKVTCRLFERATDEPSDPSRGIWSARGDCKYAFAFDADHPNAPGVGQIELEGNELVMTVTTADGPAVMKIRFRRQAEAERLLTKPK